MARNSDQTTGGAPAAPSLHPQLVRERQEREHRLAAALRENLKRRKRQARTRAAGDDEVGDGSAAGAAAQDADAAAVSALRTHLTK